MESSRASVSSRACRNERCSRVVSGSAMIRVSELTVRPTATSRAAQSSVASLCSDSRPNSSSRILASGLASLKADPISAWLIAHWVMAAAPAATSHIVVSDHR